MNKITIKLGKMVTSKYFSFGVTAVLFTILYGIGILTFKGFAKPQVFLNLLIDNAALIIVTTGLSFVLITGGIDISVGGVVAFTCMSSAYMLEYTEIPVVMVIGIVLILGIIFGFVQGFLITEFEMQPFIVTLAGQFFTRGITAVISTETINITDPVYNTIASSRIYVLPKGFVSIGVIVAIVTLVVATWVIKYTAFGRRVYAVGGSEQSATLMGLSAKSTKLAVYVISGFCAALGGIVYSWTMLSGYTLHAVGMEMDAISSSVIGGTLLTGGVGFLPGALFGVLIQGVIQTFITFQGTLSAWWTKIVIASLLCAFIVMQTFLTKRKKMIASNK